MVSEDSCCSILINSGHHILGVILTVKNGRSISLDVLKQKTLNTTACHCSPKGQEEYCVGWLHNQLGSGNNILLRLKMLNYENTNDIRIIGVQHIKFEDTVPKETV